MNINDLKEYIGFLSRKKGSGFLSGDQFNTLVQNESASTFRELNPYEKKKDGSTPRPGFQDIPAELHSFIEYDYPVIFSQGKAARPADCKDPITLLHTSGVNNSGTIAPKYYEVEIVDNQFKNYRLGSKIVPPTRENPICFFKQDIIEIYPDDLLSAKMDYLRLPKKEKWAYTISNNREVYDPANSVDPEWDDTVVLARIVPRILMSLGISIKDGELLSYAQYQSQQQ